MRAKEYIYRHRDELRNADLLLDAISGLQPLRGDKTATARYVSQKLSADIRYQQYLLQKDFYDRGNVLQQEEPEFECYKNELPLDVAPEVRRELFEVIATDASYGYLFYILGTEHNSHHLTEPIDCIPDEVKIREAIVRQRDAYPCSSLDDYLNDSLNYDFYNQLADKDCFQNDFEVSAYFNRIYEMYDHLRLERFSITNVRNYLTGQEFPSDLQMYLAYRFMMRLVDEDEETDESMIRIRKELERITRPYAEQAGPEDGQTPEESPVFLTTERGYKIDYIRVLNALYELGFFKGKNGKRLSKKAFFTAMGQVANIDLSNYDKDLSRSTSDSTALDKHLKIFRLMKEKMEEIFNSK